jgi:starch phosphorylase
MTGTTFRLEVQPTIPTALERLKDLSNDLLYSWDRQVRGLFRTLDHDLWDACGHNPIVFLRRVDQQRLEQAASNPVFMESYSQALSRFDAYHRERAKSTVVQLLDPQTDLVAYFCAEFGLHESFPIYSGGLGILAGDHCKAASDLGLPFVAIGLLYRQGYFNQIINSNGDQVAQYNPTDFADLPVQPVTDEQGNELRISVPMPGRDVALRIWKARAGHIKLYLLDCDLPENSESDRAITYQLYGGDETTRIQQEMVLGVGGTRALRALGLQPTVWHINEGHAAFQILERCRELTKNQSSFNGALEAVAAATVFTTHTPVPAGHDIFHHALAKPYLEALLAKESITLEQTLALGTSDAGSDRFNMTALALRGSRFHNGVSAIHGGVAAETESYIWPEISATDNPIGYVTNGVHLQTFLAREWANQFELQWGSQWREELLNNEFWEKVLEIPDHTYWSVRQTLKSYMLQSLFERKSLQYRRAHLSAAQIEQLTHLISRPDRDVLVLGFARRFATYKRAHLLFSDPERLARLVNNPDRPVLIVFAGKAHPKDGPGQGLIKMIHDFNRRPEFAGKVVLLEGYDLSLAREMVAGVDVWLNTPQYPLEASGTSGQKAGMNGVINLSVLDGWWGEGFDGSNGWGITPHDPGADEELRNREEGEALLDIIEHEVIPTYFEHNGRGYSDRWVALSKASMSTIIPRYNSQRMVMDYLRNYYVKAKHQGAVLGADNASVAESLAEWKTHVRNCWPRVAFGHADQAREQIHTSDKLALAVSVQLDCLTAQDVVVECLLGNESTDGRFEVLKSHAFESTGVDDQGRTRFELQLDPPSAGLYQYRVRTYPYHRLLSHPFECGLMRWL